MKSIRIDIPAIPENIRMIESFIDNARDQFPMDDDIYGNIMISVTEAVNNAIRHGSQMNPEKSVSLALSLDDQGLKFRIQDSGAGFNYHNIPDPTMPDNIDKPAGRGIFLMKHLADEVSFQDEGRIVELSFYVNG
jgi:serine/threonine-protein kinase RsbW